MDNPIINPWAGIHNLNPESSADRLKKQKTYKDLSTIIICPTRGTIHCKVVQSWMSLIRPMNQVVIGPVFASGMEVGHAYEDMISGIVNNPNFNNFKYILTIEEDNLPSPDGLMKLYEHMDKYDVIGGLYWTKGEEGQPMCYDKDTEILTESGWKYFKDVSIGERVATLSPSKEIIYQSISDKQVFKYTGEMYRWATQRVNLMVTPEHSVYCKRRSGSKFELMSAKNASELSRIKFLRNGTWNGIEQEWYTLPDGRTVKMDDWLEFLGYYISEGCCPNVIGKNSNKIDIRQFKGDVYEKINNVLERLDFSPRPIEGRIYFNDKIVRSIISILGKAADKYVPEYIKTLSSRQIEIFLKALWLGDGSTITVGNIKKWNVYVTKSKRLSDDVQELLLKIGKVGVVGRRENNTGGVYVVSVSHSSFEPTIKDKPQKVFYDDLVYDVTVPEYHTLYVRRNGRPIWSGNCYGNPMEIPKNFRPQVPVEDNIQPCNGLGMGFTLFKLDIFRDTRLRRPWFRTAQDYNPHSGTQLYTQDLYFFENAGLHGYRFACDTRVKVGHYDSVSDKIW